ncbi:MAG: ubiquitin-like small modifier protein 1 [Thermoanaerobaculia bacterium]
MPLRFLIPGPLQDLAGDRRQVVVDARARSVGEALGLLWTECPAVRDRVMSETGNVREHVNIFVDGESIRYTGGLATPVRSESEIVIFPALSGG